MTVVDSSRRPRDAEHTKETILQVATTLFAAQGFEATSVQQVAAAAGVARATPSYFFGSKEGLWRAVLEVQNLAAIRVAPEALARLTGGASAEAQVHALIDVYFEFLERHPDFFRLIQWSELQHNPAINALPSHWDALSQAVAAVTSVLARSSQPGQDPKQVLMSILGMCNAHLVYGNTLGQPLGVDVTDSEFLEARKTHLKRLLVAALL